MRLFVVLCLVAVACADDLGYNYQPVGHGSNNLPSYAAPQGGADYGAGSLSGASFDGSQGAPNFAAASNPAPSYAGPQGDLGQASQDDAAYAPQADFDKEFITYSANEDDFNDPAASNQLANSVKQGLRVVFIKGPENKGLEDAALALAKQAGEQKTAIYVLQKQADLGNLANKLNNVNKNNNNKPEVHFVKYRTPEDAANAQRAIQSQYDSLGGPSQSHNGGVAPVLNFASSAPIASHGAASSPSSSYIPPASGSLASGPIASRPGASYLPPSIFRRLRL